MGYLSHYYGYRTVKAFCFLGLFGLAVCCSSGSNNEGSPSGDASDLDEIDATQTLDSTETEDAAQTVDSIETSDPLEVIDSTETDAVPSSNNPISFTVIGDVPYDSNQRENLVKLIEAHNAQSKSKFVMHIGDIKPGADACDETIYDDVSGLLRRFETPTFIVLGDNEYNDCDNPEDALALWNQYFLGFHENWDVEPEVYNQEERPENFGWVQNGVLYLGLNLVGSSVHDEAEWNRRLSDNADWVDDKFDEHSEGIEAAVIFGHANMTEIGPEKFAPFTDRFRAAAKNFEKPVLYLHGDGHFWFRNRPWPEKNILRLQIQGGSEAVQVTVDTSIDETFAFDREFLN